MKVRDAIVAVTPLTNPRLSEVDWDAVDVYMAAEQRATPTDSEAPVRDAVAASGPADPTLTPLRAGSVETTTGPTSPA